MQAAKMETASEKYRRIKQERARNEELFDFESPSGMVWKLRKLNLAQFIALGIMPLSYAEKVADAVKEADGDKTKAFIAMDWKDKVRTLELSNTIVRHCAVVPRIVEHPSAPDEIGYDEVEMDDYNAIVAWAVPGGDGAGSLDTFRQE